MLKNMSFTLRKNLKLNASFTNKIKIIWTAFNLLISTTEKLPSAFSFGGVSKPTTRMIATRTTPHINRAKQKPLLAGYKFKVHGINSVRVRAIRENQPVHALYKSYVKLRGGKFYWKR